MKDDILKKIDELLNNNYDWEDIGYEKPTVKDIEQAKMIMSDFISTLNDNGYSLDTLHKPFISNSEIGGATIAWRETTKSLYFDINHETSESTKIWRDGDQTIAKTDTFDKNDYIELWKWVAE